MKDIVPFFESGQFIIYCCDFEKIYSLIGTFDMIITAPSWGKKPVIMKGCGGFDKDHPMKRKKYKDDWDIRRPTKKMFSNMNNIAKTVIIFGWKHFEDLLPKPKFWMKWEKSIKHPNRSSSELIWTNITEIEGEKVIDCEWNGIFGKENKGRIHSAQKPVKIFREIISFVDSINKKKVVRILDPYMGAGTALVAAKELGIQAAGVEIKEKYCQAAKNRLAGIPFDDEITGRKPGLFF